jgi:hypothetical protein
MALDNNHVISNIIEKSYIKKGGEGQKKALSYFIHKLGMARIVFE